MESCVHVVLNSHDKYIMPSLTFNKLPAAKREKFIRVAMEEFASAGYEKASVTQMVKKLKIAKGSVYQYFENKRELYFFLLDQAQLRRQEYMKPILRNPPGNFWETYVRLFESSLRFDSENPTMSMLIANASHERYAEDLGNLMLNQKKKSLDFMRGLLERELLSGGLRYDIDVDVMAFFAANITNGIWDYLTIKNLNTAANKKGQVKLPQEQVLKVLEDLSKLLKNGLTS